MDLRPSETYMRTQLQISRVLGTWPCPEQTALWKKILFKLLFYAMFSIKLCTLTAAICHIYNEWGNLPDPGGSVIILNAHFNNIISMLYISIKRNKFQQLLEKMDQHFILPSNPSQRHVFEETMKSASFVTMMFFGSAMCTGFSYGIVPFAGNSNDTTARPLPYQAALPFDKSQPLGFWAAYLLLEMSMLTMCINVLAACDFFVSLIVKTTGQFRFLQLMLVNIREETIQRNEEKQRDKTKKERKIDRTQTTLPVLNLTDMNDKILTGLMENDELNKKKELDSEFVKRMSECIKYHQVLLQFVCDLETEASPFMLFQMLVYVIFLCMNVFVMSLVPVISSEFLQTLTFSTCVLLLVLLLCWYGNELTLQSLEVAKAAYDCDWCDLPLSVKRSLTMVMFRAQTPVALSAWKFFRVDLGTFVTVIRATYSFYQVLHKVYN